MEIKKKIEEDLKQALRDNDRLKLSVLRLAKSAVKNAEIDMKEELDEAGVVKVLKKEAKKRKDSIEQFQKGGRDELAKQEASELQILEAYLPEEISEDDIRRIVKEVINESGEQNFGKLMGLVMSRLGGQADGSQVKRILEEELE